MKLWKASTASTSQKMALISAHQSVPFFSGAAAGWFVSSSGAWTGSVALTLIFLQSAGR